jgi:hypothetical protein
MHPFASAVGQEKATPRMAAQMMSGFIEVLQKMSRCNNRAASNWFRNRRDHSRRDRLACGSGVPSGADADNRNAADLRSQARPPRAKAILNHGDAEMRQLGLNRTPASRLAPSGKSPAYVQRRKN